MGELLNYRDEVIKAMKLLAEDERVIFVGQNTLYPGSASYETLQSISDNRKIEVPIFEDTQLGMSTGLALAGYIPVSIFPRMDFLILATNQLVNHLDKIEGMSCGQFKPKVIIRTMVGTTKPLDPGPQHCQDHTVALQHLLTNIDVVKLVNAEDIVPAYRRAVKSERSTILIEFLEKVRGSEW